MKPFGSLALGYEKQGIPALKLGDPRHEVIKVGTS